MCNVKAITIIRIFCCFVYSWWLRYIIHFFETRLVTRYKKKKMEKKIDLYCTFTFIYPLFQYTVPVWTFQMYGYGLLCLWLVYIFLWWWYVVCDWLAWFLQGDEEEGLNGEGEDTIDSDFSLGIRSQSFATGPPKVERSQVHCSLHLDVNQNLSMQSKLSAMYQ